MDFLLEVVIQVFLQFVVDFVAEYLLQAGFRSASNVLRSRAGRLLVGALVGAGFGYAWGHHLSGGESWPKLLWVSIALGACAAVGAAYRAARPARLVRPDDVPGGDGVVSELLSPPWRWDVERLAEFAVLNAAIAIGIGAGFDPGW